MTEALTPARASRGIAVADDRRTQDLAAGVSAAETSSGGPPPGRGSDSSGSGSGSGTVRGGSGRRRRLGPGRPVPFGRLLGPVLLIAAWWAASAAGVLDPRILSGPGSVVSTAVDLVADGRLQGNVLISLQRAGLGLVFGVLAGVTLAVVAGLSRTGEYLVDGPLQIKRAIPSLAMLPLLILWLGIGEDMKVTVIALGVAVNMYINTYASLTGIDSRHVELAEVLRLSRWRFVRKVVIPGSLPGFFVGLRLGVTSSWLGLIVVEQINATSGIGYMMFQAQQYAQSDVIIVGLVAYGVFGFASDALVRTVERRALSWRRTLAG
ncbi:ABC transporter permease [Streptomyces sp. Je 1-79]|uniref:ABC transporter permease n=1 Tax=Streptomyces sp. Je 1-79 TaxID=2943847 RepID=UPI0021A705D6|nr:ABC transporter permease [Streptomyces sp. Je 1-79]MCT4351752.1 ABC transporter permease [Streptomyces sp. Je 1-79]